MKYLLFLYPFLSLFTVREEKSKATATVGDENSKATAPDLGKGSGNTDEPHKCEQRLIPI